MDSMVFLCTTFNSFIMDSNISNLLSMFICQMTGEDFLKLHYYANNTQTPKTPQTKYAYGIQALSEYIGCCESTVYELKKKGILDKAIISHVGRKIVFDAEMARQLASEYQTIQRQK